MNNRQKFSAHKKRAKERDMIKNLNHKTNGPSIYRCTIAWGFLTKDQPYIHDNN